MKRNALAPAALALSLAAAACGPDGSARPPAAGNVIEVKMVTDEKGNYFEPAQIAASPGDVLRFTLVTGVHGVSFSPGKNDAAADLPRVAALLQASGETVDVTVPSTAGTYNFQCDPHVALGMVGTLTVQ